MKNERPSQGYSEVVGVVTINLMNHVDELEGYSRALYAIPEVIDNNPQNPLLPLTFMGTEKPWPSTREFKGENIYIGYGLIWKLGTDIQLNGKDVHVSIRRSHDIGDDYKIEIWPVEKNGDYRGSVYGTYELRPEGDYEIKRVIPVNSTEKSVNDIVEEEDMVDEGIVWIQENHGELNLAQMGALVAALKSVGHKLEQVVTSLNS